MNADPLSGDRSRGNRSYSAAIPPSAAAPGADETRKVSSTLPGGARRLARARENAGSKSTGHKTPVRAIALSISSIPVAAPAPGHDPRRHLMTAASRAHEKTRRGWLTREDAPKRLG